MGTDHVVRRGRAVRRHRGCGRSGWRVGATERRRGGVARVWVRGEQGRTARAAGERTRTTGGQRRRRALGAGRSLSALGRRRAASSFWLNRSSRRLPAHTRLQSLVQAQARRRSTARHRCYTQIRSGAPCLSCRGRKWKNGDKARWIARVVQQLCRALPTHERRHSTKELMQLV